MIDCHVTNRVRDPRRAAAREALITVDDLTPTIRIRDERGTVYVFLASSRAARELAAALEVAAGAKALTEITTETTRN